LLGRFNIVIVYIYFLYKGIGMSVTLKRTSDCFPAVDKCKHTTSRATKREYGQDNTGKINSLTSSIPRIEVQKVQRNPPKETPPKVVQKLDAKIKSGQMNRVNEPKSSTPILSEETEEIEDEVLEEVSEGVTSKDLTYASVNLIFHTICAGMLIANLCQYLRIEKPTESDINIASFLHIHWSFFSKVTAIKPNWDMLNNLGPTTASSSTVHKVSRFVKKMWEYQISIAKNARLMGHILVAIKYCPWTGIEIPPLSLRNTLMANGVLHCFQVAEFMTKKTLSIRTKIFGR
jgi:hypothetical protein